MSFHVIISGGGIGGLCLAQGLKKAGISVGVYERDRSRTDRLQGYRIHIDPDGSRALHAALPEGLFEAFAATCGKPGSGFRILTHQLHELMFAAADTAEDPIARHRSVSRITLRQVLLAGLDGIVHFDKQFSHYEDGANEQVVAHFADGSSAAGDLLVAADGVNSKIRQQLLPGCEPEHTGVTGIAAKVPIDPKFDRFDGATMVTGPRSDGMFIARQEFENPGKHALDGIGGDDENSAIYPGLLFDNTQSYIFWGYMTRHENYATEVSDEIAAHRLLEIVTERTRAWHPELRELIRKSDPSTVGVWKIRTSRAMEHWRTRNITFIGDAIHSMTPARGIGANIALRDADLLRRKLMAASQGAGLLGSVEEYELEMMRYAFRAVAESSQALQMFVGGASLSSAADFHV